MAYPLDVSLLPPADCVFAVMSDTHAMLDPGSQKIEFESRRQQSSRARFALAKVASLHLEHVVHLGDLVQEFPGGPGFEQSLALAIEAFDDAGVSAHQVAGNHDVGDKPDPTMPTEWVTEASLMSFHARFGHSWRSWNSDGYHFIILNSQIMNGELSAAIEQQVWLEADLAAHQEVPTFIFQHLAPFLVREDDPGLGHYDTIDEPARTWLLGCIRSHNVIGVFYGHSHFAFVNRIGDARAWLVPSTAFTRPGFCEVFSSAPPPERGRDDAEKLGFFLVRTHGSVPRVHLVRTSGYNDDSVLPYHARQVVTCVTGDLPASPLGVTLRHPLTNETEVPIAWQSVVRQPVRNDFPLLACLELGVRHLRTTASDLANPLQCERLQMLRNEGVSITSAWVWSNRLDLVGVVEQYRGLFDTVEIQLADHLLPDSACLEAIVFIRERLGLKVMLTTLNPREHVAGKQHTRTRTGFHVDELLLLGDFLEQHNVRIDRVLCRVDIDQDPATIIASAPTTSPESAIGVIDWAVEFSEDSGTDQCGRGLSALVGMLDHAESRLYLEPFVDMDRTMDAPKGLLDRRSNPKTVFHALRVLNSLLYRQGAGWFGIDADFVPSDIGVTGEAGRLRIMSIQNGKPVALPDGSHQVYFLEHGTVTDIDAMAEWIPEQSGWIAIRSD